MAGPKSDRKRLDANAERARDAEMTEFVKKDDRGDDDDEGQHILQ